MSHITVIKTKMLEREFVLKAIEDLGYRYEEGDLKLGIVAGSTPVQIKILLPMSFDIGLKATPDGYSVVADWWGVRGVKREDFMQRLMQRYSYHATRQKLESQGFSLIEETTKDGQIHLTLRRMA